MFVLGLDFLSQNSSWYYQLQNPDSYHNRNLQRTLLLAFSLRATDIPPTLAPERFPLPRSEGSRQSVFGSLRSLCVNFNFERSILWKQFEAVGVHS